MTVVVGLASGERGGSALDLATMLATSLGEAVVAATIIPTPWPPSPNLIDAEYIELLEESAMEAAVVARSRLQPSDRVTFETYRARTVASGIVEAADQHGASMVVLGSSAAAMSGRVALGGVTNRILHSLAIPVVVAPVGFTAHRGAHVTRVTVAFGRADRDSDLLVRAATVAERIAAEVRVACFAVRPLQSLGGTIEVGAENLVVDSWTTSIERAMDTAMAARTQTLPATIAPDSLKISVGQGLSWQEAVDDISWSDGELLVVGSSSSPISRFFLGSHAAKIVRHAPVPVMIVPRESVTAAE